MKRNDMAFYSMLICGWLLTAACTSSVSMSTNSKKAPPGQVKKVTGSQSAKPYAPGQQKKNKSN